MPPKCNCVMCQKEFYSYPRNEGDGPSLWEMLRCRECLQRLIQLTTPSGE